MKSEYPIIHDVEQGSETWLKLRRGKFTGSEFFKLMKGGTRPMTDEEIEIAILQKNKRRTVYILFGDGAMTYIYTILDEIITLHDFNDFGRTFDGSKVTEWGHINEPGAREYFEIETGLKTETVGFIQLAEFFGSSPDFICENGIGEIKCPFNPVNHTANIFLKNEYDLKEAHYDYYIQMQIEMIACGKEKGFFVSFDPLKANKKLQIKIIEVKKDEKLCDEIWMRYNEAVKILDSLKKQLFEMI